MSNAIRLCKRCLTVVLLSCLFLISLRLTKVLDGMLLDTKVYFANWLMEEQLHGKQIQIDEKGKLIKIEELDFDMTIKALNLCLLQQEQSELLLTMVRQTASDK